MEMSIHFQVLCDDVAGKTDHILQTPKRLQAAVSNRSAGGKTPPFASLLASSCGFRRHFNPMCEFTTYADYCPA
ncbi:hypothetical protein C7476_1414 [Phyllobacterium bourgognense]|uniref:Uncharacterized protein n=1 Tax=Phyllobacterium bourgognense TaxID=314236 RepID=A0A368YDY6_9HYPH|nr:hypothetical protein C7476_1414 [Phyllobacterium bourgognense]